MNEVKDADYARDQLARAILDNQQAGVLVEERRAAHARAEALVAAVRAKCRSLETTLGCETQSAARLIAAKLREGEALEPVATQNSVRGALQAVEQQLEEAMLARDELARDLTEARTRSVETEDAVRRAALTVLGIEGDLLADQIQEHEKALHALRDNLRGLDAASWGLSSGEGSNWQRPALLSPRARAALAPTEPPQVVPALDPSKEFARRWCLLFKALLVDANARGL